MSQLLPYCMNCGSLLSVNNHRCALCGDKTQLRHLQAPGVDEYYYIDPLYMELVVSNKFLDAITDLTIHPTDNFIGPFNSLQAIDLYLSSPFSFKSVADYNEAVLTLEPN